MMPLLIELRASPTQDVTNQLKVFALGTKVSRRIERWYASTTQVTWVEQAVRYVNLTQSPLLCTFLSFEQIYFKLKAVVVKAISSDRKSWPSSATSAVPCHLWTRQICISAGGKVPLNKLVCHV